MACFNDGDFLMISKIEWNVDLKKTCVHAFLRNT